MVRGSETVARVEYLFEFRLTERELKLPLLLTFHLHHITESLPLPSEVFVHLNRLFGIGKILTVLVMDRQKRSKFGELLYALLGLAG